MFGFSSKKKQQEQELASKKTPLELIKDGFSPTKIAALKGLSERSLLAGELSMENLRKAGVSIEDIASHHSLSLREGLIKMLNEDISYGGGDEGRRRELIDRALKSSAHFEIEKRKLSADGMAGVACNIRQDSFLFAYFDGSQAVCVKAIPSDIIGVALVEDGETISTTQQTTKIAGAIVGGALLGAGGAIVGAIAGGTQSRSVRDVNKIQLKIALSNVNLPQLTIEFTWHTVKSNSSEYRDVRSAADMWNDVLSRAIKIGEKISQSKVQTGDLAIQHRLKQCPFCAEDIRYEAIKCKHCGSMLPSET